MGCRRRSSTCRCTGRPTAFATAIVVADALVWEGAEGSLIESVVDVEDFGQMLARALLYRLVAAVEGGFEADAEIRERYSGAVDASAKLLEKP